MAPVVRPAEVTVIGLTDDKWSDLLAVLGEFDALPDLRALIATRLADKDER